MIFECTNEQFVEIKILGYEFQKISNDEWDDNWLVIHINVKSTEKHWTATAPAITTFELKGLIDWIKNISNNKIEKYKKVDFTEPNISFELLNNFDSDVKQIKINFFLEFNPLSNMDTEYFVELIATNEELKKYANELEDELKKYPERKR
jgi:hypothetical protein